MKTYKLKVAMIILAYFIAIIVSIPFVILWIVGCLVIGGILKIEQTTFKLIDIDEGIDMWNAFVSSIDIPIVQFKETFLIEKES